MNAAMILNLTSLLMGIYKKPHLYDIATIHFVSARFFTGLHTK